MSLVVDLTAQELASFVMSTDSLKSAVLSAYLEQNAPTLEVTDLTSDDSSADASTDESKEDAATA